MHKRAIISNFLPPVSIPAPKATIGGFDRMMLINNAGANFIQGVLVSPIE